MLPLSKPFGELATGLWPVNKWWPPLRNFFRRGGPTLLTLLFLFLALEGVTYLTNHFSGLLITIVLAVLLGGLFPKIFPPLAWRQWPKGGPSQPVATDNGPKPDHYLAPSHQWPLIDKTAEHVKANHNLETYVEELYLENKKINTLIDNISDAILAIGPEHKFLFANHHFRKYFIPANVSASDLATYRLWDLAPQLGEIKALFEQALREKTKTEKNNMTFVFNGQRFIVDTTITPLKDVDDSIAGAIGVFHDVTQHRLNEQFRETFVSNVSHEVRTPLTALKGYVQILKDTSFAQSELIKNSLLKIESNAARLIALFNDVLGLSMIESRQSIAKEEFFAPDFFAAIVPNLQQVYRDKDIKLIENIDCPYLYGNPALLEQAITNLLDNAYKYSGPHTQITMTAKANPEKNLATIEVADQGMGIAAEHLPRLFERFYRANASRSREIPGTGLGLAIVKHIIQKHDGKINVRSTLGEGTTFTIELPLAPPGGENTPAA